MFWKRNKIKQIFEQIEQLGHLIPSHFHGYLSGCAEPQGSVWRDDPDSAADCICVQIPICAATYRTENHMIKVNKLTTGCKNSILCPIVLHMQTEI